MPENVLVITVGGSAQPVITAIKEYEPVYIYFLCSSGGKTGSDQLVDGPGNPSGDKRTCPHCKQPLGNPEGKAIVSQTGYGPEKYEKVIISEVDNLAGCYQKAVETLEIANQRFPTAKIIGDYTAGTKTMSVGLAMAVIEHCDRYHLSQVSGERRDLIKTQDKTEQAILLTQANAIRAREHLKSTLRLIQDYNYSAASSVLRDISQMPLSETVLKKIREYRAICRAFDAWDKFDYQAALPVIEVRAKEYNAYLLTLKRLTGQIKGFPYEPVLDLMNAVDRCAHQKRYDDAASRVYRLIELLSQTRLREKYGIDSSRLEASKIPESWRNGDLPKYKEISLIQGYDLLFDLGDELGLHYSKFKNNILDQLQVRNFSKLAHGDNAIEESPFNRMREVIFKFVEEGLLTVGVKKIQRSQLPTNFISTDLF